MSNYIFLKRIFPFIVFALYPFLRLVLETSSDCDSLKTQSCNLVCCDHLSNVQHGRVCIFCKICLPLKVLYIHYWQKSINFEFKVGDKIRFMALPGYKLLYRDLGNTTQFSFLMMQFFPT